MQLLQLKRTAQRVNVRGGKRHLVQVKLKCPQHPGCPCAEDLTLPTYPYAGKEKLPESQAWSDA